MASADNAIFHLDFSRVSSRKATWFTIAILAVLFGVGFLLLNTGPKMMSADPTSGGASMFDLIGAWGPIVAGVLALIKGVYSGNVAEIVAAVRALASDPKSQELISRAEMAMLTQIKANHGSHPEVLNALSFLVAEIGKVQFPTVPTPAVKTPAAGG